jgi:hypothetical protein
MLQYPPGGLMAIGLFLFFRFWRHVATECIREFDWVFHGAPAGGAGPDMSLASGQEYIVHSAAGSRLATTFSALSSHEE